MGDSNGPFPWVALIAVSIASAAILGAVVIVACRIIDMFTG